jgi:acetyl-CoA carboxylase biotin carboxylase subunit
VRVDSHLYAGYKVPSHYDSLLAKLIVWAPTRSRAVDRLRRALAETVISGVETTVPFYQQLVDDGAFAGGHVHTGFVADFLARHTGIVSLGDD